MVRKTVADGTDPVPQEKPLPRRGDARAKPAAPAAPAAPGGDAGSPAPAAPQAPGAPGAESTQAMPRWSPTAPAAGRNAPAAGAAPGGEKVKPPPSDWFAPRKPQQAGPGQQAPDAPPSAGTPPFTATGGAPGMQQPRIPYLAEEPSAAAPGFPGQDGPGTHAATPGSGPYGTEPARETFHDGPDTGSFPAPGAGQPGAPQGGTTPFPGFHPPGQGGKPHFTDAGQPTGATSGPATGDLRIPGTPGAPAGPDAGRRPAAGEGSGDGGTVSGDTLVSGIPRVPPPGPAAAPAAPQPPAPPKSTGKPARKRRSKPMLLVVALVSAAVVAYGAGLLMNHADVPNGTTVLGVDIGGKSKEAAVEALDSAVGDRSTAPLKVRVGGKAETLKPQLAGLAIDTEATVRKVAHTDYNPVPVVESLIGGTRQVEPVVTVDQEKLRSQLQALTAGSGGSGQDGMVKFVDGTPVGVPGKPYQAVDADASVQKITDAYEKRARTGMDEPVDLTVSTHQPLVTQAAIKQAIKTIGDPAMSGRITVVAGGRSVPFSPQLSLSKILTIVPVPGSGKLTLHIDLPMLQSLYGTAFDGVLLERGNGSNTAVTPQDVASAMLPELAKTSPAKTAVISNVAR